MKNLLLKTVMLGSKFQKADIGKSFLIGDILNFPNNTRIQNFHTKFENGFT